MRAWENRPDTYVCDEPFYAHYLLNTEVDHPGKEEVIADQENDWRKVAAWLTGPVPGNKAVFYQKHMAHHFLKGMDDDWLDQLVHVFLIRHPKDMLISLSKVLKEPCLRDTGLAHQWDLFQIIRRRTGKTPMVIESESILKNPRAALSMLCESLDVPFYDSMRSWPSGPRDTDGIWAKWWYANVLQSTGFNPYKPSTATLPDELKPLYAECNQYFERLKEHSLAIS